MFSRSSGVPRSRDQVTLSHVDVRVCGIFMLTSQGGLEEANTYLHCAPAAGVTFNMYAFCTTSRERARVRVISS